MMDFEELDRLQEVLEPELLAAFKRARAPPALAEFCRERGLFTCEKFFKYVDVRRSYEPYEDYMILGPDAVEFYEDLYEVAGQLEPPATRLYEHLAIHVAWGLCRDWTVAERARREAARCAAQQRREEEQAARRLLDAERRARDAERMLQEAQDGRRRAARLREEAARRAAEAELELLRKAECVQQEAAARSQFDAHRQATLATLRGLVVPRGSRCAVSGPGHSQAALDLRKRLDELSELLARRYQHTDTSVTGAHILDQRWGPLPSNTVGYSAYWGLEATDGVDGVAVRLARSSVRLGSLVEACPLVPVKAAGLESRLRRGPLGPHAIWPTTLGVDTDAGEMLVPLGYSCLYRQSTQGWNIVPALHGDELHWLATQHLEPNDELVAPAGWPGDVAALRARAGTAVADPAADCQVEGPVLGSPRHSGSPVHRYGVFSSCTAEAGEVLEVCPALHLTNTEAQLLENYAMQFGTCGSECRVVLALGLGAVYNHRKWPQVDWLYDQEADAVVFVAKQRVEPGEELFIDYGQVYFSSRGVTPACCLAGVVWRQ